METHMENFLIQPFRGLQFLFGFGSFLVVILVLGLFLLFFFLGGWAGRGDELSYPKRTSFCAVLCMGQRCWEQNVCLTLERHASKQA